MTRDWEAVEHDRPSMRSELRRLFRRARARRTITVLAAAGFALVLVGRAVRKHPQYEARVVLRVSEQRTPEQGRTMVSPEDLGAYTEQVVFARSRLLDIIRARKLYASLHARDPQLAVEQMREDLTVTVVRNYFLEYRRRNEGPRSVRVIVEYVADDPDEASAVVRDLSELFATTLAGESKTVVVEALALAEQATVPLRERLQRHERELAATQALAGGGPSAQVEIARLQRAISADLEELAVLKTRESELRLASEAGAPWALTCHVGDIDVPPRALRSVRRFFAFGILALLAGLPLAAMAVGAFDRRVYDGGDVRRLGLEPIAYVRLE
jgi:uncharacterized protein involved in exopolysaccharide biosynthesis